MKLKKLGLIWAIGLQALAFSASTQAAIQVLACEPEWGALVGVLAGDKAKVFNATTAMQDPHHIQARPSLIAAARNADLIVSTGAELEVGWLPILLRQSGNRAIQEGQLGNFEAADFVSKLEVPTRLDRADGDVHAAGNPHVHTDPRNITVIAAALADRLAKLDPANASAYKVNHTAFASKWAAAIARWEAQAAPLRGVPIVVHHKAYPYLEKWLGLVQVGTLEPKPGVEPSSAHLSTLLSQQRQRGAALVIRSSYNDSKGADWLAQRAGIPVVVLPNTVGGSEVAKDLFGLFDDTIQRLLVGAAAYKTTKP